VEGQPEMEQNIPTEEIIEVVQNIPTGEIIEVERCNGMILPFNSLTLFTSS
jgi:hypothetical protein